MAKLVKLFVSSQALLSIDDDTDNPDDNVFYQVQSLFGHLMESKLQYYVPENFWKVLFLFRIYTFLLNLFYLFLFAEFLGIKFYLRKSKCVEIMLIGEVFLIFIWNCYLFILDIDLQDVE